MSILARSFNCFPLVGELSGDLNRLAQVLVSSRQAENQVHSIRSRLTHFLPRKVRIHAVACDAVGPPNANFWSTMGGAISSSFAPNRSTMSFCTLWMLSL